MSWFHRGCVRNPVWELVKDDDGYVVISGGVLRTEAEVFDKAKSLLGRPLNHDYPVRSKCIENKGSMRFYYIIDCSPDSHKEDINADSSDFFFNHYKPYYFKDKWRYSPFRIKRLISNALFVSSAIVFLSMFGVFALGNAPWYYDFIFIAVSILLSIICFITGIALNKYLCLNPYSVKNGVVYSLEKSVETGDEYSKFASMDEELINKALKLLEKRYGGKHAQTVIDLNKKYKDCADRDLGFITIRSPKIKNDIPYDDKELMYAYAHKGFNKLPEGELKDNQNELDDSIPADAIHTMHTLCNEIRLLEYKNFNDDSIAKSVEATMNTFIDLKNTSSKEANSIIDKMKKIKKKMNALDSQFNGMDDAITDLQNLINVRVGMEKMK